MCRYKKPIKNNKPPILKSVLCYNARLSYSLKKKTKMNMRNVFTVLILLCSSLTWAQRTVPTEMDVAVLKQVNYPQVVLSNGGFPWLKILTLGWLDNNVSAFNTTHDLRIKDERNRFIVRGKLMLHLGKTVAVRRNDAGNITEIWVLTDAEQKAFEQRAATLQP